MTESSPTKPPLPAFDPQNCQTYAASCHCGSVQYSVLLSPPLAQWKVVSCNCSICTRNGYLLVYPERSQLQVKSVGVGAQSGLILGWASLEKRRQIC
ncbi:hypothetical protein J4E86_005804 [Alternaria arbusti]|uniref:uncharacterized protein n=1 Tax=Alternaria arbusti TaxID=232088 RepID=UPI00221EE11F|nr:uncharacterized protein J4E86_005804 [Alternaria arbusti]KAI4957330.1 hypothetical protein J4E86_005804 [Alternaria arbusti]